jgi:WD40 repeat protein
MAEHESVFYFATSQNSIFSYDPMKGFARQIGRSEGEGRFTGLSFYGPNLYSSDSTGTIRIWDIRTPKPVNTIHLTTRPGRGIVDMDLAQGARVCPVCCVNIIENGRFRESRIAAIDISSPAARQDLETTGIWDSASEFTKYGIQYTCIAVAPGGLAYIAGTLGGRVVIGFLDDPKKITVLAGHVSDSKDAVNLAAVNAVIWHGEMGMSAGSDGYVKNYSLKDPQSPRQEAGKQIIAKEGDKAYPVTAIRAVEYDPQNDKFDIIVAVGNDWSLGQSSPSRWSNVRVFRVRDYKRVSTDSHLDMMRQ